MTTKKIARNKTTSKKLSGTQKSTIRKAAAAKPAGKKAKSKARTKADSSASASGAGSKKKVGAQKASTTKVSSTQKTVAKATSLKKVIRSREVPTAPNTSRVVDAQMSLFDTSPLGQRGPAPATASAPIPLAVAPSGPTATRWPENVVVHTDGACRGNPGPSSIGLHFLDAQGAELDRLGEKIGMQTNNFAEYTAVIRALEVAALHGVRRITIRSDSELMVRQMQGIYKVKSEAIRPLFERVKLLQAQFAEVRYEHVRREYNVEADRLANLALDGRL